MDAQRLTLLIGALAFLLAVGVVAGIAVTRDGPVADTALGALIALVSAGGSYFLRGRVQNPEEGQVTLSANAPATATLRAAAPLGEPAASGVAAPPEQKR
jgi:hypothetical protein